MQVARRRPITEQEKHALTRSQNDLRFKLGFFSSFFLALSGTFFTKASTKIIEVGNRVFNVRIKKTSSLHLTISVNAAELTLLKIKYETN